MLCFCERCQGKQTHQAIITNQPILFAFLDLLPPPSRRDLHKTSLPSGLLVIR